MDMATPNKEARLQARLSDTQKALMEQAAAIRGTSLSDFVVNAAQAAAEEVVRERQIIYLSAAESRTFAEALLNPSEPNDAMRKAFSHYGTVGGK